jgi:putative Ca2+/H+ antiporter (TMEM165/GDT1 family)
MEAFFVSTSLVAIAEMGDKTQLLALLLAARYRQPVPIIIGILLATLLNHGLAAVVGVWITKQLSPETLRWGLAAAFAIMALWVLVPDRMDDEPGTAPRRLGVFATTLLVFFLAEMGDKTQIATLAMAVRYSDLVVVVVGSTLGMLLANVPVVLLGERVTARIPAARIRLLAAVSFVVVGVLTLLTGSA